MKYFIILTLVSFGLSTLQAQELKSTKDTLSYLLGVDIGRSLAETGVELNEEVFRTAFYTALKKGNSLFTEAESTQILRREMTKIAERKREGLKQEGIDYLDQNKLKPGVQQAQGGLQYLILKDGMGSYPTAEDEVLVHYKGTLIDGTVFDSSYDRGEPLSLELERVIEGWKIGIPLMRVGSQYRFFVPSELGYGERQTGAIPSFSVLVFDIELLDIISQNEV